ncbi:PKD domain-containing protein [Flavobacterium rhizosphaerae]|uniref:PKD domain-containing protein n=1 Tax=Flavobacterium rhizosphaerae TaxID=3163298 RepID=A0ABW8Z2V6_9FLAO
MKQNYLKLSLLIMIGFVFFTRKVNAQNMVYATTVVASSNADNTTSATDQNLATYANIRASSGTIAGIAGYTGFLEIGFTTPLAANTTTYVKIGMDEAILSSLLGGSLSVLTSGVLQSTLLGSQQFTVQVKNGTTSLFTAQSTVPSDFDSQNIRIVTDAAGNYYFMITPTATYNRIRITNTLTAALGLNQTKRFYVYDAFTYNENATCELGKYTSYSSSGVTLALLDDDTVVEDPENAIDSNSSTFSQLKIGALGVTASVQQSVYFEGPSSVTDKFNITLSVPPALLNASLQDDVSIIAYNGQNVVQTYSLSSLLDLDLIGLLQDGQPVTITIMPGIADRVVVRLSTTAEVVLAQSINLYTVTKDNFLLTVTGGGSYLVGQTATISAAASGCSAPYTYVWSGDTNATGQTITPSTETPGTYNFRVTVTDTYGVSRFEDVEIVVEAPPVGGIVSQDQVVCAGTSAADLTLLGYTGSVVRWETSFDEEFSSPQTINVTTATLASEDIGVVNQTTYVRAVVGNATYDNVYSEVAELSVKSTTWNGTVWNNGVPDVNTTIYITGNYNESTDLNGCSLTVENNAEVVIPSGYTVTLQYAINVIDGSFTIENDANLVQIEGVENTGNITVVKKANELFRLDYTLWSSPVTGQQLKSFSPLTLSTRFYTYGTATETYEYVDPLANTFQPGVGYLIRMPNRLESTSNPNFFNYNAIQYAYAFEGHFTGVPNNGDVSVSVSTANLRFNGIGNPYPSPINVEDFFAANEDNIEPGEGLILWRKINNDDATSYAVLTLEGYVPNPATGGEPGEEAYGGVEQQAYFENTPVSQWAISQGQGFIIRAAEGATSVSFTNAMRRGAHDLPFWRTAEGMPKSRLWLQIKDNDTDATSIAALSYSEYGTTGIDFARDARIFEEEIPLKLYSVNGEDKFVMQARPLFDDSDVVPIGFNAENAGNYTLEIYKEDGVFADGQDICKR